MKPVVDRLADNYTGRITFYLYPEADNNSDHADFADHQGVEAVPTMALVSAEGTEIERWVGTTTEAELATAFDASLAR